MSGLTGIAAVLAAVGLSAESKDSVSRAAFDSAITAALAEGERMGVIKAGSDAAKITADASAAGNVRAKAILSHADAKGREDLALHLAFDTEMSAEAAATMLGKAPKAEAKGSRLDALMPNNAPQLKEPGAGNDPDAQRGAALNAAVDAEVKRRGLTPVTH